MHPRLSPPAFSPAINVNKSRLGKKIFELFRNSFFIEEITEVEASMLPAIAKLFSIQESEISIVFIPEKTCVSPFALTTMI